MSYNVERWSSEAAFFDKVADANALDLQLDPDILQRYRGPLRRIYAKEFLFGFLGDLAGKHVLDLGCGEGCNSVLLAKRGAQVTGIDVSPKSIELATARAKANEVDEQCNFICSPIESTDLPENSFDVIWINDLLHHIIPELDSILARIRAWCKPKARLAINEPVSLSRLLRRVRPLVPVPVDATPDERPLQPQELRRILSYFPELKIQYCHLLSRLDRIILPGLNNYEAASSLRRRITDVIHWTDYVLLALPGMRHFAGCVSIYGEVSTEQRRRERRGPSNPGEGSRKKKRS
jgi:2-polyprenyl-3-methyl-5-hydroxy-6-metoxy-1,4-benzoquinol methylase